MSLKQVTELKKTELKRSTPSQTQAQHIPTRNIVLFALTQL